MATLSITSLSRSYRAGVDGCSARVSVLRGLDLALWPGEIVALAGARASGRTTLLRCAAGILQPDAGSISWLGARSAPRGAIAYVGTGSAHPSSGESIRGLNDCGALYSTLHQRSATRARLLLIDDLEHATRIERRLVLSLVRRYALAGAAVLFAADEELAALPGVTRVVALTNGALAQRRKRSAARIAASSRASRARTSARSTYGRSFRSPQ
ncbi:MAG TPA: ATP-binding cassette domain-containing protein [Gemmatimonadaceae bacterium]|nr:ATP-binding cassette domain-containing protein [Gemmatimonadaceae bacterium]